MLPRVSVSMCYKATPQQFAVSQWAVEKVNLLYTVLVAVKSGRQTSGLTCMYIRVCMLMTINVHCTVHVIMNLALFSLSSLSLLFLSLPLHSPPLLPPSLSTVVSGSRDATLRVWSVANGSCINVLQGHVGAVRWWATGIRIEYVNPSVYAIEMNAFGSYLSVSSSLSHFSPSSPSPLSLPPPTSLSLSVQFDGKYVVSGAYDFLVKVWDPIDASCIYTLQGHTNRVYSLLVSLTVYMYTVSNKE